MATTKPQFNCYVDPQIQKEINEHLTRTGLAKGKLVETMWRVFSMKSIPTMVERLELYISRGMQERDIVHLKRLSLLLQRMLPDTRL
jgi:hypothetical protein